MKIGIPAEIVTGETRVALIPESVGQLVKKGYEVLVQTGAGDRASFLNSVYERAGARILADAASVYSESDLILKVQRPVVNPQTGKLEVDMLRPGSALITFFQPLVNHDLVKKLRDGQVTSFSMDAIPRTTRAQNMDALSSMSTVAGYKAVLLGAANLGRFFPLLMTAAGTVPPARVFVLGAGVAGLMAIATAKRLGAVVEAFDVRAAVKEQVESLGAKFVEMPLEESAEGTGGYAKELSEDTHRREVELLHRHVREADVVITTALIPGRPAPELITEDMVRDMKPGSVIVDLAAENGGNCVLTERDADIIRHNVRILGPTNLPATMPVHASQLYSKNVMNLLGLLLKDGGLVIDMDDDIVAGTLITRDGKITNARVLEVVEPNTERSVA
jgi:NAD(P) transhydrogenase subunit alpha